MTMSKNAIVLKNITKTFKLKNLNTTTFRQLLTSFGGNKNRHKSITALNNINLKIKHGETIGIIGRNGSGKSTLINIIMQSIKPDHGGTVKTNGKIIRLALGLGIDNNLTARDNIYINGSVLGLSFKKIGKIFDEIISFAGLEEFVDTKVKFYSKGMKQRLFFSIAMHTEADILLLDEFFGGTGDQEFKIKSDQAFKEKILEGKTIVIVSHSMPTIEKYCDRTIWLHKGNIVEMGASNEITELYLNKFKNKPIGKAAKR
jgi:ABC-type polysaccharide/polyol phosphate transport system ATPase subunit